MSEERGDASCYAFWQRGRDCIFDVRITDTEARSHRNKYPKKVLAQQEKEKKKKYLNTCHELRKDFTPYFILLTAWQGERLGVRNGGWHTIWRQSGQDHRASW